MRFLKAGPKMPPVPKSNREFLDKISDPGILTSHIVGAKPVTQSKAYDCIHISQIDSVCPREYVLGKLSQTSRKEVTSFPLGVVYNMGSALHFWIQNHPEIYFGEDKVLGYWRCLACGRTRRFGTKPKDVCEFCGARPQAAVYQEYSFFLDKHGVAGSIDLILRVGTKYRLVDIKTIAKEITSPSGPNVSQLASYMYFSQFDVPGLPVKIDRSVGYLTYFSKVFNFRSPVSTFKVVPTERLLAPLIDKSRQFVRGVSTKELPAPKQACVRKNFYFSKNQSCALVESCKRFFFEGVTHYD